MQLKNLFNFSPETVVGSVSATATGLALSEVNQILGNIVIVAQILFLVVGIIKNLPLKNLSDAVKKITKKED